MAFPSSAPFGGTFPQGKAFKPQLFSFLPPQKGGPLIDTKQFQRRVLAVVVLMALLLTGLGSVLYDLQINNGEAYRRQSQYKIAETETVEAGRGQILDRNGRVLVSDKAV